MVNKAIVGILVLIVLTSLGVGVLIGTQLGGDGGVSDVQDGGTDGSAPGEGAGTPTQSETTATATVEPTSTATPTQTPTPTATLAPAREFDAEVIEREIVTDIDRERSDRGLEPFDTDVTTAREVRQMARYFSQAMAAEQSLSYSADGNTTAERYEAAELFGRCGYQDSRTGDIIDPDDDFQSLGRTVAGQEYEDDGEVRTNENESQIAQAIVGDWFDSSTYREPLVNGDVSIVGVGVTITESGDVYATAAICS